MTDISKCEGTGCAKTDSCWRFLAPEDEHWQSYVEVPKDTDNCGMYWQKGVDEIAGKAVG